MINVPNIHQIKKTWNCSFGEGVGGIYTMQRQGEREFLKVRINQTNTIRYSI